MTFSSCSPRSSLRCVGPRSRDRATAATRRSILSATFSLLSSTPREFPQQQRFRSIALGGPCAVRRSEFSGSDDPLPDADSCQGGLAESAGIRYVRRSPSPTSARLSDRAGWAPTAMHTAASAVATVLLRLSMQVPQRFSTHHTTQRIVVFDGLLMEQRWRLPSSGGLLPSRVRIANPSASRCSAVPVADPN